MAGAGKKTFVAGEVLTAAQVNDYLMDQAVMRFSGSAARAASITAPTEGMVTYLDDSNVLEYYDGSAWVEVVPQAQIDGAIQASLITASGQVLVGAAAASLIALGGGTEGQVLTLNSASPGGVGWQSPGGGGKAAYQQVTATNTNIALQTTLTPGFYRIQLSNTTTYTSAQFRLVDADGNFYGATITSGAGFFTIPVQVASVNVTTGTVPFFCLVEEIKGVSDVLIGEPTITNFAWDTINGGSVVYTAAPAAASVGAFDTTTGSFSNLGPASVGTTNSTNIVSGATWAPASLNASATVRIVNSDPNGIWSIAASATTPGYPFQRFVANGTYVPPPWSSSVDVLLVGGGGGSGYAESPASYIKSGGGGAGGASVFTGLATPGSVAVVVGAGGSGGATSRTNGSNGSPSTFLTASVAGGGGGGFGSNGPSVQGVGQPGGSGGGGGIRAFAPGGTVGAGGTGIAGQGNNGAAGNLTGPLGPLRPAGGGGGKGGVASAPTGGIGDTFFGLLIGTGGDGGRNQYSKADGTDGLGNGARGLGGITGAGSSGGDGTVIVKAL